MKISCVSFLCWCSYCDSSSKRARRALDLRLAALRVLAHPFQLGLHRLDARGLLARLDLQALLLLLEPARVVAFPRDAVAAVELEDPARRVVEEVAVVRDRDHGSRKALQELLQPLHALGVEVVGRLVQQQQIRLGQQQPAERHAALLAAREHVDLLLPRRQAQRVGRDLELVGAAGVDDAPRARACSSASLSKSASGSEYAAYTSSSRFFAAAVSPSDSSTLP